MPLSPAPARRGSRRSRCAACAGSRQSPPRRHLQPQHSTAQQHESDSIQFNSDQMDESCLHLICSAGTAFKRSQDRHKVHLVGICNHSVSTARPGQEHSTLHHGVHTAEHTPDTPRTPSALHPTNPRKLGPTNPNYKVVNQNPQLERLWSQQNTHPCSPPPAGRPQQHSPPPAPAACPAAWPSGRPR